MRLWRRGAHADSLRPLPFAREHHTGTTAWRYVLFSAGPAHVPFRALAGPRLVEANCGRWNGIPTQLVAARCFGVTAQELTATCYLGDAAEWQAAAPDVPPKELLAHGRIAHLVSSHDGVLRRLRHGWRLSRLRSLVQYAPRYRCRGDRIKRTTCFNTCAGEAHLVSGDAQVVRRDYLTLRKLQPTLFAVDTRRRTLYVRRGSVVRRVATSSGGRQLTVAQLVVDGMEMAERGSVPRDGSMAGVRRVRLISASREVTVVEAEELAPPEWEVVA